LICCGSSKYSPAGAAPAHNAKAAPMVVLKIDRIIEFSLKSYWSYRRGKSRRGSEGQGRNVTVGEATNQNGNFRPKCFLKSFLFSNKA
jgi:hypothetical protein